MSSSFSGSTAQGRHFAAWSLVSWFFLLKEHGIMVVGFNILGLWSHKKSRQIGSWGSHWHGHVWMSWWGVWSLLPGPALPFLPDECMKPHFREAGSKHLALSKSRFVAPNHEWTWIGLSPVLQLVLYFPHVCMQCGSSSQFWTLFCQQANGLKWVLPNCVTENFWVSYSEIKSSVSWPQTCLI